MPKRQKRLRAIVETEYALTNERPQKILLRDYVYHFELVRIYHTLGGTLDEFPRGMGEYDISTPYFVLELDEEQHFNRYRGLTLTSSIIYDNIPKFPMLRYAAFCRQFENNCRTDNKFGHSESSMIQFQENSLCEQGCEEMSRWKQRAFYDYLKDSVSLITGKPLIRISIYDEILDAQAITIGAILNRDNYMDFKDILLDYIKCQI